MWLVVETAGVVCGALTYIIVLTVQVGMIRVGVWEGLLAGELKAWLHLAIFQYHCAMIFCCHFKCMTTEPGVLPMNYTTLSFKKIASPMREAILGVKKEAVKMSSDNHMKQEELERIDKLISAQIKELDQLN